MEIGRGRCGAQAEDRDDNQNVVVNVLKHICQYHIDLFEPGRERARDCIFLWL